MKIKLNGHVSILGEHAFFDGFEIKIGDDLDLPFDDIECDIEEYIEDCEDCGFCNCDCDCDEDDEVEFNLDDDERFEHYTDDYKEFLSKYVRKIYESDFCPYCIADVLDEFYEDKFVV